jgi:hypothetical protein
VGRVDREKSHFCPSGLGGFFHFMRSSAKLDSSTLPSGVASMGIDWPAESKQANHLPQNTSKSEYVSRPWMHDSATVSTNASNHCLAIEMM